MLANRHREQEIDKDETDSACMKSHDILIKTFPGKGRGLVSSACLAQNTVIDESPVILIPRDEVKGVLAEYTFRWSLSHDALALGLGSLFNHAREPNCAYQLEKAQDVIVFKTRRPIGAGEELTISYGREEILWWGQASTEDSNDSEEEDVDPLSKVTL